MLNIVRTPSGIELGSIASMPFRKWSLREKSMRRGKILEIILRVHSMITNELGEASDAISD